MALRTVVKSPNSVTIDNNNLLIINNNKPALDIPTYWHKFIITNFHGLTRNIVLKILLDHIKPLEFIPLCYTENGIEAFFFARMCRHVIEKLCYDNLTIPNPTNKTKPFKLKIILRYSSTNTIKIDITRNLLTVLKKRFKDNILCLNNFYEDPDLKEFILLSQPKLLAFVLNIAKKLKPKSIQLCNNEIVTLEAFKIISESSIVSLDLRNNLIRDLAELKELQNLNISELWLEGNPLCELYDEYNYKHNVISYCPKIQKLDGFLLRQNGVPSFRRNFLCDISAYDIIDQFLESYFSTFDSKNLTTLKDFYHTNALFSMTADFVGVTPNSQTTLYKDCSRNLLNFSVDTMRNLYYGRSEIVNFFGSLSYPEHDPYTFTVDVLFYTDKCAVVVVTGVFREFPETDRLLGFSRNFLLEKKHEVYRISNEQMHVFSAFNSQKIIAFKKSGVLQEAHNTSQKIQMIEAFSAITNLTKNWSKIFLEEYQYNMKHATLCFLELYKSDKIPSQGFQSLD